MRDAECGLCKPELEREACGLGVAVCGLGKEDDRMKRFVLFLLFAALGPLRSLAQMPSEVLLVVNQSSPRALHVANVYQDLRGIPDQRVLFLSPPDDLFRKDDEMRWVLGEARARNNILAPIDEKLAALRDPFPTAIVFSPDWPTAIALTNGPAVSLTAFVGAGGRLPPGPQINQGQAVSPWFTHPKDLGRPGSRLHRFPAKGLPPNGLRPAMMLGVFHPPLTEPILVEALRRAAAADHTFPVGTICILTNADVRTKARHDQFGSAVSSLETKEIAVSLQAQNAPLPARITGIMAGTANMPMDRFKGKIAPGAFAEHLTSFAATFQTPGQTKMTHWIAQGAAGTVGTIQEPFAIWTKFPMAVVFERYADGNTLLESLYQSIASPWQSLPMGDPLCRPWGRPLAGLKLTTRWEGHTLRLEAEAPGLTGADLALFVDGQAVAGSGPRWHWEGNPETSGSEIGLLLHARKVWAPPETAMVRKTLKTPFPTALTIRCEQGMAFGVKKAVNGVAFTANSQADLVQWEIWKGERRLVALDATGKRQKTSLPWSDLGQGPSTLHARAITRNGHRVRSAPLRIEIE